MIYAPDGIGGQARDGTVGGVDGVELDAERELHGAVVGVDVDDSADRTEGLTDTINGEQDCVVRARGELPVDMVGVGFDLDGDLDLTLILIELGSVLGLGQGEGVAGDVVDDEAMLLEEVLGFSSVAEVIEAKQDTTDIGRDAGGEASILEDSQQGQDT
jgi:hypothetical protein